MKGTVYTRMTRPEVERLIRSLPRLLSGLDPDPLGIAESVQLACGVELLSKIQTAFLAKSRREPSEDGIVWPPLSERTIAARMERGRAPGNTLDPEEAGLYDILRDTGLMFRSLSPGVFSFDSAAPGAEFQIFDRLPGRVIVGTNRYPQHHTGIPGKLPKRELWPSDGNLPEAWWVDIVEVSVDALYTGLIFVLSGGGRIPTV